MHEQHIFHSSHFGVVDIPVSNNPCHLRFSRDTAQFIGEM